MKFSLTIWAKIDGAVCYGASHIVGNPYRQVIAINEGNCEENTVVKIWEDSVDKCNGRTVVKVIISVPLQGPFGNGGRRNTGASVRIT